MPEKKKNELSEKELKQAAGGSSRRDIASDPRSRKRAADKLGGANPDENKPDRGDVRADRLK